MSCKYDDRTRLIYSEDTFLKEENEKNEFLV